MDPARRATVSVASHTDALSAMRGRAAADGLLDDLEALLDGEMAMASELSELRQALQQSQRALAATGQSVCDRDGSSSEPAVGEQTKSDLETRALLEEALEELEHSTAERELVRRQGEVQRAELERELQVVRAELVQRDQELRVARHMAQQMMFDLNWALAATASHVTDATEPSTGPAETLLSAPRSLETEVVELSAALHAERHKSEVLTMALDHAQSRLDEAQKKLDKREKFAPGMSRQAELQALKDRLDESRARERNFQQQHQRVTKRLQTYLADRGDFSLLQDLSENMDHHEASRGIADLLEHFVLQFGTLQPDFEDEIYRSVFKNLVRWCHEPWPHVSAASSKSSVDASQPGADSRACSNNITRNIAAMCGILARSEDARERMLPCGVVDAMVALLKRSQHAGTLEQACACISNLMLHSNAGREAVVASGGLGALITQLHASVNSRVQEKACSAMANLACSRLTKEVIATHKGVLPLVEICRAKLCDKTTENASRAIRNLAHNSASNSSVIASCGGLDVMASLCEHTEHDGIASQASAAIANLAVFPQNRAELKERWGWSAKVMFQLDSSSSKHRHKSEHILATRCLPIVPGKPIVLGKEATFARQPHSSGGRGADDEEWSTLSRSSKSPISRSPNSTILSTYTPPTPSHLGRSLSQARTGVGGVSVASVNSSTASPSSRREQNGGTTTYAQLHSSKAQCQ